MFNHKKHSSKRVRFGLEDECYKFKRRESNQTSSGDGSPPPFTLSYASSNSSVSTRPYTPPPPYSYPSAPTRHSKDSSAIWTSPILNYPSIPWDVSKHPSKSMAQQISAYGEKPFIVYNPNKLTALTLVHPSLRWWPLRIDLDAKRHLTVQDFYVVLYRHLNEPLTNAELTHYGKNDVIQRTFSQRCRERRLNPAKEATRRLDCLGFARIFNGIKETEDDPEIWELILL